MTSDLLLKMDHALIRFHDVDFDLRRNRPTPIDFNVLPAKIFTTTYPATPADAAFWQSEHPAEAALDVRPPETTALSHIFKTQGYTELARNDAFAVLGGFCIPLATKLDLAGDAPIHAARTMLYIFGAGGTGKSEVFKMVTSGTPEALTANFPGADRNYPASEVYDCRDTALYLTNSDLSTDPSTHASLDMLKKTALGEAQSITAKNRPSVSYSNNSAHVLLASNTTFPVASNADSDPIDRRLSQLGFPLAINRDHMDLRVASVLEASYGDCVIATVRAYFSKMVELTANNVSTPNWTSVLSRDLEDRRVAAKAACTEIVATGRKRQLDAGLRALLVRGCFQLNTDRQNPAVNGTDVARVCKAAVAAIHDGAAEQRAAADDTAADDDDDQLDAHDAAAPATDFDAQFADIFPAAKMRTVRFGEAIMAAAFPAAGDISYRVNNRRFFYIRAVDNPAAGVRAQFQAHLAAVDNDTTDKPGVIPPAFVPGQPPVNHPPKDTVESLADVLADVRVTWVDDSGDAASPPFARQRSAVKSDPKPADAAANPHPADHFAAILDDAPAAALPNQAPFNAVLDAAPAEVAPAAALPHQAPFNAILDVAQLNVAPAAAPPADDLFTNDSDSDVDFDNAKPPAAPAAPPRPNLLPRPAADASADLDPNSDSVTAVARAHRDPDTEPTPCPSIPSHPPPPPAAPSSPLRQRTLFAGPKDDYHAEAGRRGLLPTTTAKQPPRPSPPDDSARPGPAYPGLHDVSATTYFNKSSFYGSLYGMPAANDAITVSGAVEGIFVAGRQRNYMIKFSQFSGRPRVSDPDNIMAEVPSCPLCLWTLCPRPWNTWPNWTCPHCNPGQSLATARAERAPVWPSSPPPDHGLALAKQFQASANLRGVALVAVRRHLAANTKGSVANVTAMATTARPLKRMTPASPYRPASYCQVGPYLLLSSGLLIRC